MRFCLGAHSMHEGRAKRLKGASVTVSTYGIDHIVEGFTQDKAWTFAASNSTTQTPSRFIANQSVAARARRRNECRFQRRPPRRISLSFLRCPILRTPETRLDKGAVNVLVGEGRTAEVLRNAL